VGLGKAEVGLVGALKERQNGIRVWVGGGVNGDTSVLFSALSTVALNTAVSAVTEIVTEVEEKIEKESKEPCCFFLPFSMRPAVFFLP
jgi:hypothetical protein